MVVGKVVISDNAPVSNEADAIILIGNAVNHVQERILVQRCNWCTGDRLYVEYHDEEWGVPNKDARTLFEFLILEGAQAGLSWLTILRKRQNYRIAFDDFNPEKMAGYDSARLTRLLNNDGIIRNKLKLDSAVKNARAFLELESGSVGFSKYIWSFVDGTPVQNKWSDLKQIPVANAASTAMSKDLKKKGFSFVGPTICYAFMQATGMINDHLIYCHRYRACQQIGKQL